MKKLISVLLVALMLISSVTAVMADGADGAIEYELFTGTDVANYAMLKSTTFPAVSGLINYTMSSNRWYVPANTAKGTVGYGCLPLRKTNSSNAAQYDPIAFSEILNGDNIYDYQLQIEFQRVTGTNYVKDVGIGLGNYQADNKAADSCANKPSVAKTIDCGDAFAGMASGDTTTLTVDIADILDKGHEQQFAYGSVAPNDLTPSNANLVAIKMTYNNNGTGKVNVIQVNSVKLIKKQASDGPVLDETVKFIDLISHTVDGNAFLLNSTIPKLDDNSYNFATWQKNTAALGSNSVVDGDYRFGLGGRSGRTFESQLNGGKLEDYVLEFTVTKKSGTDYIKDIEFGLGAANTEGNTTFTNGTTYGGFSTVIKTVAFNDFSTQYNAMASGDTATLSIPVKEIIKNGTEQVLIGTNGKDAPDFNGGYINLFILKAKCQNTSGGNSPQVLQFNTVKLVKKNAEITYRESEETIIFSACDYTPDPSLADNQAIVAYYNDYDGTGIYNLSYCDVMPLERVDANNATLSVPLNGSWGGSDKIKAFILDSMDRLIPLTPAKVIR